MGIKPTAQPYDYTVRAEVQYTDYGTQVGLMVCIKDGNHRLGVSWDVAEGPGLVAAKLRALAKFLEDHARAP